MKCFNCGKETNDNTYCSYCGEKLDDSDKIVVKSNYISSFFLIISTAILIILGIFLLYMNINKLTSSNMIVSNKKETIIFIFVFIFFLLCCSIAFVCLLKRILCRHSLIIINKSGIIDNINLITHGLIKWNDIESINLKIVILGIKRRVQQKYLEIKKKDGKKTLISLAAINIKPEVLIQEILDYREKIKQTEM